MTEERYKLLNETGTGLTQAELDAGWHFCPAWDDLLIGPDHSEETLCCTCYPKEAE